MKRQKIMCRAAQPRQKFVIRLHLEVREQLEAEAVRRNIKLGTLVSVITKEEAGKLSTAYTFPDQLDLYTLTRQPIPQAAKQISVYVSEEDKTAIEKFAKAAHVTIQTCLTGMLLNHIVAAYASLHLNPVFLK